jgi:hypothetical protein
MKIFFVLFLTFGLLCTCHEQLAASHNPPPHGHNLNMSSRPEILIFVLVIMAVAFIIQHHCEIWEGMKKVVDYIRNRGQRLSSIEDETINATNKSLSAMVNQLQQIQQTNKPCTFDKEAQTDEIFIEDKEQNFQISINDMRIVLEAERMIAQNCDNITDLFLKKCGVGEKSTMISSKTITENDCVGEATQTDLLVRSQSTTVNKEEPLVVIRNHN